VFDSLELDAVSLSHLDYHWFWGLRYSKTPQPANLGVAVDKLMEDKAKLTELIETQANLYFSFYLSRR
jgi:hypothetical protein